MTIDNLTIDVEMNISPSLESARKCLTVVNWYCESHPGSEINWKEKNLYVLNVREVEE